MQEQHGLLCLSGPGTFAYRTMFRNMGFRWRGDLKCWVTEDRSEQMRSHLQTVMGDDYQTHQPSRISYKAKQQTTNKEFVDVPGKKVKHVKDYETAPQVRVTFEDIDEPTPQMPPSFPHSKRAPEIKRMPNQQFVQREQQQQHYQPPMRQRRYEEELPVLFNADRDIDLVVDDPNEFYYYQ